MGKQANILSFDEAKRSVAAPRSSASARSRSRAESRHAPGTSTRRGAASTGYRGAASTRGVSSPALVQVPRSTAARRSGDGAYAASSRAAVTSFPTSSDYSRAGTSARRSGARDVRVNRFAPERDFELERELGFEGGFGDQEQAEYAAIEQRNASLESEVNALQTDAGVEDRAHQQFGWVKEGEQTANVKGLTPKEDESTFTANIIPGSVKAPETWYSPLLDAVFGVQ